MKGNKFAGADDIYLTRGGRIAAKRVSSYVDKKGVYHHNEKTKYYAATSKNLAQAKKIDRNLSKKK